MGINEVWVKKLVKTHHCPQSLMCFDKLFKVERILKDSLDSIPSSSPSAKIQIMGGKISLSCIGKTLLGIVNFPANNLNLHSRWRWWDWIQDIFLNLFYFKKTHVWIFWNSDKSYMNHREIWVIWFFWFFLLQQMSQELVLHINCKSDIWKKHYFIFKVNWN